MMRVLVVLSLLVGTARADVALPSDDWREICRAPLERAGYAWWSTVAVFRKTDVLRMAFPREVRTLSAGEQVYTSGVGFSVTFKDKWLRVFVGRRADGTRVEDTGWLTPEMFHHRYVERHVGALSAYVETNVIVGKANFVREMREAVDECLRGVYR
jgi:hypothetical protein